MPNKPDQEARPAHKPAIVQLPYCVDPSVLRPGLVIYDMLDGERTPLEVLRVEPVLVCRAPDGSEVEVYAHLAQPHEAPRHPGPDCDCDMCRSRIS